MGAAWAPWGWATEVARSVGGVVCVGGRVSRLRRVGWNGSCKLPLQREVQGLSGAAT